MLRLPLARNGTRNSGHEFTVTTDGVVVRELGVWDNGADGGSRKDAGHALICGPTGSGKTVFIGFLIAMLTRQGITQIVFDKDRGLEILIRALGGAYFPLKSGTPTGFNPLQLPDAGVAPKAPVHPQIVENDEPDRAGKENVGENDSQVLTNPLEVLEANDERNDRREDQRHCVHQEEVPVPHPLGNQRAYGHLRVEGGCDVIAERLAVLYAILEPMHSTRGCQTSFANDRLRDR